MYKFKKVKAFMLAAAVAISACFASCVPAFAQDAEEPVVIDNYGIETTYESAPERVVSLSYAVTEVLLALDLGDKIVGIAEADNTVEVISEEYQEEAAALNIIAAAEDGGVPTLEVVLAQSPDFVYGSSYSFNANYGVGDPSDFQNNGINIYASINTYKSSPTIEDLYEDILNMGKIFRVEEKAEELVAQMEEEIAEITEITSGAEPVTVLLYDSGEDSPLVYSTSSYESALVALIGAENIYSDDEASIARLSWEAVIEANPDYIIINDYAGETAEEKIEFLKNNSVLQGITAIQEENFVVVPLEQAYFGALTNITALETMARGLYPDLFE